MAEGQEILQNFEENHERWTQFCLNKLETVNESNSTEISKYFHDLFVNLYSNKDSQEISEETLAKLQKRDISSQIDPQTLFLDCVWLELNSSLSKVFISKLLSLSPQIFSKRQILTTVELTHLPQKALGIPSVKVLTDRMIKKRSTLFFAQKKFNLLTEENEGFSKLLSVLVEGNSSKLSDITAIVGSFHLDPIRVVDVAFHSMIVRVHTMLLHVVSSKDQGGIMFKKQLQKLKNLFQKNNLYYELFQYKVEALPQIIGFTLNNKEEDDVKYLQAVYYTIALLLEFDIVSFESLQPHIFPVEMAKELINDTNTVYCAEVKKLKAHGKVSLSGGASNRNNVEDDDDLTSLQVQHSVLLLLYCLFDVRSRKSEQLCYDLISLGINPLLFRNLIFVDNASSDEYDLGEVVLLYLKHLMESTKFSDNSNNLDIECVKHVHRLVKLMLKFSNMLTKRCNNITNDLIKIAKQLEEGSSHREEMIQLIMHILCTQKDPAPQLFTDVFTLLHTMDVAKRYQFYTVFEIIGLGNLRMAPRNIDLEYVCSLPKPLEQIRSEVHIHKKARDILKRTSAQNLEVQSKLIAQQLACVNPYPLIDIIIDQISSYENLIPLLVESFKHWTPFARDLIGYGIYKRLKRQQQLQIPLSTGFHQFVASVLQKYPKTVDSKVIFDTVLKQLHSRFEDPGLLRNLVQLVIKILLTTGNLVNTSNLAFNQIYARAGGQVLTEEVGKFGHFEKVDPESIDVLRNRFMSYSMGFWSILSKIGEFIIMTSGSDDMNEVVGEKVELKELIEQYDQICLSTGLFLDFLGDSGHSLMYTAHLPDSTFLAKILKREIYWMVLRPAVRLSAYPNVADSEKCQESNVQDMSKFSFNALMNIYNEGKLSLEILSQSLQECFYTHKLYDIYIPEDIYEKEMNRLTRTTGNNLNEIARMKNLATQMKDERKHQLNQIKCVSDKVQSQKDSLFRNDLVYIREFISHVLKRALLSSEDALYSAKFIFFMLEHRASGFFILETLNELINSIALTCSSVTEAQASCIGVLLHEIWKHISGWRYSNVQFEKARALASACEKVSKIDSLKEAVKKTETKATDLDRDTKMDESEDGGEDFSKEDIDSNNEEVGAIDEIKPLSLSMSPNDYKHLYDQWHEVVSSLFIGAIDDDEYMHTRCSLIILSRMVTVFPTKPSVGELLLEKLLPLQSDDRPDFKVMATTYSGQLTSAKKDGAWAEMDANEESAMIKAEEEKKKERALQARLRDEKMAAEIKEADKKLGMDSGPRKGYGTPSFNPPQRPVSSIMRGPSGPHQGAPPIFQPRRGNASIPPPPPPPPQQQGGGFVPPDSTKRPGIMLNPPRFTDKRPRHGRSGGYMRR